MEQVRIPAHEDNLRRGSASCFTTEAVSAFTEIPGVGLNPPDPVWGGSCVAGDQGRGNGLETVGSWKIVRIRSVARD